MPVSVERAEVATDELVAAFSRLLPQLSRSAPALDLAALERARELGARTVDLTSRPSREAANRLYQKLGFERRESLLYRYSPDG